jgi:hypothetical protein
MTDVIDHHKIKQTFAYQKFALYNIGIAKKLHQG